MMTLMGAVKERRLLREDIVKNANKSSRGGLFGAITCFSLAMLYLEAGVHILGWQPLQWPSAFNFQWLLHMVSLGWMYLRTGYFAPVLQKIIDLCIWLFLIQSVDRIIRCMGCMYIKWWNIKPVPKNPSLESDNIDQPDKGHPMVLVQIPMYNEREVLTLTLAFLLVFFFCC